MPIVARAAQHLRIFSQVLSQRGEDWGHLRKGEMLENESRSEPDPNIKGKRSFVPNI